MVSERFFHRRVTFLIALFSAMLAGIASGEAASPYELSDRGIAEYDNGQFKAATALFATVVGALPDRAQAHFNHGDALYKLRDYRGAAEAFAQALRQDQGALASRIKYNLGNVKYQQALHAMHTFQDVTTPLRAAMTYYRESLRLDPDQPDARYNLELAHHLLELIHQQKVQKQKNAKLRDQKTSENEGQKADEDNSEDRENGQTTDDESKEGEPSTKVTQAPQDMKSGQASTQSQQSQQQQELSPEEAEQQIEMLQGLSRDAEDQRQQMRAARLRAGSRGRTW